MEPQRWQHIKSIFNEALELPESEQRNFVVRSCGDDQQLLDQLEQLLRDHHRAGDFIETPVLGRPGVVPIAVEIDNLPGQTVGHYKILHKIGQGGMSTVYLAARDDQQYQQHVAVKIIRRGMDSEFIVARFRQERQILASLDHPSIAKLLDGGTLEDGRPYLVMEHIEGEPVDTYCERAGLDLRQRLKLFRKICSAVQYAHQNLVVHRDLKPSNILVTGDGVPRVLDFGTAKLLEPLPVMMGVTPTAADLRLMTPEYASPEQMRGTPITTASDVYSLGVVLFELITGQRPYRLPERTSLEAARIVSEEPVERPSQALSRPVERAAPAATPAPGAERDSADTSLNKLRRKLEGDLDNIVLMTLRKEPQRRYASVEQLSSDIDRHLRGLPVSARRDTLGYRASKFILRHRLAVVAAGLAVIALLAGIVAISWQARIAQSARLRAEQGLEEVQAEKAKNERIFQFVLEIFRVADPDNSRGEELTAREILDRAASVLDGRLLEEPAERSELLDVIGQLLHNLGFYGPSGERLEEAVEIRRQIFGNDSLALAESLDHLGLLQADAGYYAESRQALEKALEIRQQQLATEDQRVGESLAHLGRLELREGLYVEAEEHFQAALAIHRTAPDPRPLDVAIALQGLGEIASKNKSYAEAESYHRQVLDIRLHELGEIHPDVADVIDFLGRAVSYQGRLEEAEELFRRELRINRSLYGEVHPAIAITLNNLATLSYREGHYEEAETRFLEILEIQQQVLAADHPDLLTSLANLGTVLSKQGRSGEAAGYLEQALTIRLRKLGPDHLDTASARYNLAVVLTKAGQPKRAEALLHQALESRREQLDPADPDLLRARLGLAAALADLGRTAEAEREMLDTYTVASANPERAEPQARRAAKLLADLYASRGDSAQEQRYRSLAAPPG